jgi:hypothetical protein
MTSREIIRKCVHFDGPPRIGLRFAAAPEKSDILGTGPGPAPGWQPKVENEDEWGFVWHTEVEDGRVKAAMGQVKTHPLADWAAWADFVPPDGSAPERFAGAKAFRDATPDKYVTGSIGISGFNRMMFIRGLENLMIDMVADRDRFEALADVVFRFETDLIHGMGKCGLDGIWFGDDWGTQRGLMIRPALWRELFKPRFAEQFAVAHSYGMDVIFHSCGQVYDIIGDLIEIGADMLNLNQPDLWGAGTLARDFGGKVCFHCPVDAQRTLVTGPIEAIRAKAKELVDDLGCYNGGFVACADEAWEHGSVPAEHVAAMSAAFEELAGLR